MSGLLLLLKSEPVATMAIVQACNGLALVLGAPEKVCAAVAILAAAILAFPVRGAVAPLTHVVATANAAADAAAKATAERLTPETVGNRGELGGTALGIATEEAATAADSALRELGVGRKERAA